jgi:hypothetical protein
VQRVAWIKNTLDLNRLAISPALAREAGGFKGWRLEPATLAPGFDRAGDLQSPLKP